MKISKKVVIKRNPEQVWQCLTKIKNKNNKSGTDQLSFIEDSIVGFKGHNDKWRVTSTDNTRKLKLRRNNSGTKVNLDIKLTKSKTRTELQLTLSGWENADTETKKSDIPRLSLNWEKTLSKLKEVAESK